MTHERRLHTIAVALMVAGVAAGAACWAFDDTAVWVLSGIALVLIVAGIFVAGRASEAQRKREDEQR